LDRFVTAGLKMNTLDLTLIFKANVLAGGDWEELGRCRLSGEKDALGTRRVARC
jgi:hypothetical protein